MEESEEEDPPAILPLVLAADDDRRWLGKARPRSTYPSAGGGRGCGRDIAVSKERREHIETRSMGWLVLISSIGGGLAVEGQRENSSPSVCL